MFAYCSNNPIAYSDSTGYRMVHALSRDVGGAVHNQADRVVTENKDIIKEMAANYNVDPNVLAGCIYVEQFYNYDWIDELTDVSLFFMDTSVGVGQVKISTAKLLAANGYIQPLESISNLQLAQKLQNDTVFNIQCAAAYLSYLDTYWDAAYDVSADPAIWGTLYNMGALTPQNNPKPNWFGEKVNGYGWYMELLLN